MKTAGRTFIVSGGSSGLGLATVQDLISADAYISILDRSPPPKDLATSRVKFFQTDITEVDQIEKAVNGTVEWTAVTGAPLGGVINCAGVGTAGKIVDAHNEPHSLDLWNFTLAVNLTGSFNLTRLALRHLVKVAPEDGVDGERGVVVLVSSAAALGCSSKANPGQTAYAATKGCLKVDDPALSLATSLGTLFASSSMTANFPDKTRRSLENEGIAYPRRFGQPSEFAQTIRWILECPYVNGETIRLSGAGRLPGKL
ncbi:3-hydroxy-acyl-CoA-dehydrogenase [Mycena filopes]|nr:3-hydroxy-acyl-CoA-dehydrogenase [Mycena filopes]